LKKIAKEKEMGKRKALNELIKGPEINLFPKFFWIC